MGGSHSREGLDLSDDSDYENDDDQNSQSDSEDNYQDAQDDHKSVPIDDIDAKLKALKLKYSQNPNLNPNSVKLYLHTQGKWIISDKLTSYKFIKLQNDDVTSDVITDDEDDDNNTTGYWYLKVGSKVRVRVSTDMQLKMFADQRRVDFVDSKVWAMRFFKPEDYRAFVDLFQNSLFENVYGLKASDENKVRVYGKDFLGWAKPEIADDTMWENEEDGEWRNVEKT